MAAQNMIIPVAGGKGGTGKSFLTANLAIALANLNKSVLVIDLDFGGSNLHSYLGIQNIYPGIGDFLKARSADLQDLVIQTPVPNLSFLPGDGQTPFMANINYGQKVRLQRTIKKLDADYILMDLGAGSGFNTLDLFTLSLQGLLITSPEYPAIMNLMVFLKNLFLRIIDRQIRKDSAAKKYMKSLISQPMSSQKQTLAHIIDHIKTIDAGAAQLAREKCAAYRPRIIYNQIEDRAELGALKKIDANLRQRLSLEAEYIGFLPLATSIKESVRNRQVYLTSHSDSMIAKLIQVFAKRIDQIGTAHISNSIDLIYKDAEKIFSV